MNGHSKTNVNANGNGSLEPRECNHITKSANGRACLADSGIDNKLSSALKRFFSAIAYKNVSKKTACASQTSRTCNTSNYNSSCRNYSSNANNNLSTNTALNANDHTALIANNDCMSKPLDHIDHDLNDYCFIQPSTSNVSSSLMQQRKRHYKYSIY